MAHGIPFVTPSGGEGSTLADSDVYTIPTISPTPTNRLALFIVSGRTDGTAAAPISVDGLGVTWAFDRSVQGNLGNYVISSYYQVSGTPTATELTVAFPAVQMNMLWALVELPGAKVVSPLRQSAANSETVSGTVPLVIDLVSPVENDSMLLSIGCIASSSQDLTPVVDFTDISAHPTTTEPSIQLAIAYAVGLQTQQMQWESTGAALKAGMVMELAPEPVTDKWTYKRFVRIG